MCSNGLFSCYSELYFPLFVVGVAVWAAVQWFCGFLRGLLGLDGVSFEYPLLLYFTLISIIKENLYEFPISLS